MREEKKHEGNALNNFKLEFEDMPHSTKKLYRPSRTRARSSDSDLFTRFGRILGKALVSVLGRIKCLFGHHDWKRWRYKKIGIKTRNCKRCKSNQWRVTDHKRFWKGQK